ncbi:hypothetical protein [Marinomonas gallaica]|uniref:hypothetical protein n=1 Tax=Marinomonas gallaica TaxID=1806667 RepID=UPI003A9498E9
MKKVNFPKVDDIKVLDDLSKNKFLSRTSYPLLLRDKNKVEDSYRDYNNKKGNVFNISFVKIDFDLKSALLKNYNSPPKELSFIPILRDSSPEVCPMCGAFYPQELDHIMPKEDYPAWTVFSRNLVPACSCNKKRGRTLKGNNNERILHPYFDDFLKDRLLTTSFSYDVNLKLIDAKVDYVDENHSEILSIKFHAESIVLKNGIEKWLRGQINSLNVFPANVIKNIPRKKKIKVRKLIILLKELLESYDDQTGSKNNWNSILIHGLLYAPSSLHRFIVKQHNNSIN